MSQNSGNPNAEHKNQKNTMQFPYLDIEKILNDVNVYMQNNSEEGILKQMRVNSFIQSSILNTPGWNVDLYLKFIERYNNDDYKSSSVTYTSTQSPTSSVNTSDNKSAVDCDTGNSTSYIPNVSKFQHSINRFDVNDDMFKKLDSLSFNNLDSILSSTVDVNKVTQSNQPNQPNQPIKPNQPTQLNQPIKPNSSVENNLSPIVSFILDDNLSWRSQAGLTPDTIISENPYKNFTKKNQS
jgi:hypothetical protein